MSDKIIFVDSVGRKLIGVLKNATDTHIVVENPAIINAVPMKNGQMSLQLIPEFFREIQADQNEVQVFTYPKSMIAIININNLVKGVEVQYQTLFKEAPVSIDAVPADDKVIDLFSENTNG